MKRFLIDVLVLVAYFIFGIWIGMSEMKDTATERGYGEYCLKDGRWAWIGECVK